MSEKAKTIYQLLINLAGKGTMAGEYRSLDRDADLDKAFDAPGLLEKLIDFDKEISVIVARNSHGEIKTFPPVEMVFHPEQNLVEYLFAPCRHF
jgi:5-(carboxyamino)imidazole ribonucleotide synthase